MYRIGGGGDIPVDMRKPRKPRQKLTREDRLRRFEENERKIEANAEKRKHRYRKGSTNPMTRRGAIISQGYHAFKDFYGAENLRKLGGLRGYMRELKIYRTTRGGLLEKYGPWPYLLNQK